MIELTFQKELILLSQTHQKSVTFVIIGVFRLSVYVSSRCL